MGGESVGVVDLIAVRKDHRSRKVGMKRGDTLQIILIQVKGGRSAMPTAEDARRLRAVAKRHYAEQSLLAIWKKGRRHDSYGYKPRLRLARAIGRK
jgi:hypothetical protein